MFYLLKSKNIEEIEEASYTGENGEKIIEMESE